MNEKPICLSCRNYMQVKMAVRGQAQTNHHGVIELIGPVRTEVMQGACKLAPIVVLDNPCVIECSEYAASEEIKSLAKPVAAAAHVQPGRA